MEPTVRLCTADLAEFQIPRRVAEISVTVRDMLLDLPDTTVVRLGNVSSRALAKVLEYCHFHADAPAAEAAEAWDALFVSGMDRDDLFEVMIAANYLNVSGLLDVACDAVAKDIQHRSPEEIRAIFRIENDFTPEEEDAIRRENQWSFE